MVAGAQARDAKRASGAFESPKDRRRVAEFRGSFSGYERNVLFANVGAGQPFVEVGYAWGLDDDADGRAVAPLDFDGDGDQDLVVLSMQHLKLWRNETPARPWARFELRATRTEASALGAEVLVTAEGRRQLDRVRLTAGFHTQVARELHFGLGEARGVDEVEVRWPSGDVQRWRDLPANRRVVLTEGVATFASEAVPRWPRSPSPLPTGDYDLAVEATDLDGKSALLAYVGRPTVVNFWAPWCEACQRELPALAALAAEWGDKARFVGVSVETKKIDTVREFIARYGLGYAQRLANDEVVRSFFGAEGEMPLPATFVFDDRGQLVRALFREVNRAEVDALLRSAKGQTSTTDLLDLATAAYRARDLARGRSLVRRAGRSDPMGAAQTAFMNQDWPTAAKLTDAVLAAEPKHARALALRGAVATVRGAMDRARADIEAAVRLAPNDPQVLHNQGMYLKISGDRPGAIRAFQAALRADPEMHLAASQLRALGVEVSPPRE